MANRKERKVIRGIIHKRCGSCGIYKPETSFDICRAAWDNRQCSCIWCQRRYLRSWRIANRG